MEIDAKRWIEVIDKVEKLKYETDDLFGKFAERCKLYKKEGLTDAEVATIEIGFLWAYINNNIGE